MTYRKLYPFILVLLLIVAISGKIGFAQQGRDRSVVVTSGDTFSTIALREFGSSSYGRLIAEYNNLGYRIGLRVGQIVRVPLQASSQTDSAEVFFAKGTPLLLIAGASDQSQYLRIGDEVFAKDIIRTGASDFVSLRFSSGTAVNIQPNSVVQLMELDCLERSINCLVELTASEGSVNSNVVQRGRQPTRMFINTPHASAAVRGTVFDVDASSDRLLVGVTEGEVDVSAQGLSTGLLQGLGVKTLAGQTSEPPVKLLSAPSTRRLPPRVTTEDLLGWYPMPGAASYLVSISRDDAGSETLYQADEIQTQHQIQRVAAGAYFLGVRGLDNDGFRGFSSIVPLSIATVDETVTTVNVTLTVDNDERILTVSDAPEDAQAIEVQLSETEDFLELSSVDVPLDGGVVFVPTGRAQFARARVLVDETTTGPLGPVLDLPLR